MSGSRASIYYWKCDRPAAFHGIFRPSEAADADIIPPLTALLQEAFGGPIALQPAGGQGNHHTYLLQQADRKSFVRVEDGPEGDNHLEMESQVLSAVGKTGVPVPQVFFTDASRQRVPFAVQVIQYFDCPDLNAFYRAGSLPLTAIAKKIGKNMARWQSVPVSKFGPFEAKAPNTSSGLRGYHRSYAAYFQLHLERHLRLLEAAQFLSDAEASEIYSLVERHAALLELEESCLVHKDLALWNIMGTPKEISAFIDWDDAIAGDPTDDLSLLACFYSTPVIQAAVDGYASERSLPHNFLPRFWLHLLRNMLVKSVIRCGAGYFEPTATGAFLMASGQDGPAFKAFTRERLLLACKGLEEEKFLEDL